MNFSLCRLKKISILLLFVVTTILAACKSSVSKSKNTNVENNDGWKLLFDGKTTLGWHTYGKGQLLSNTDYTFV